jgi:hypothetical protein
MKRFLSIVAGLLAGAILGALFYGFPGKFLIAAPVPASSLWLPEGMQSRFLLSCLQYGVIPGAAIGALGGAITPLFQPRGLMTKSIGLLIWPIVTVLAWITQWEGFIAATGGKKAIIILVTLFSLVLIIPVSGLLGNSIERMRE